MTGVTFPELLHLIDERSAALRDAVAVASDLGAQVPGCPEWSLTDLVTHLGHVQRWWSVVVRAGESDHPPAFDDGEPGGDLLEWSAESTQLLLAALGEVGPDQPCWTWWPLSDALQTRFVRLFKTVCLAHAVRSGSDATVKSRLERLVSAECRPLLGAERGNNRTIDLSNP